MENIGQFEMAARDEIWLYMNEYCMAKAFNVDFRPDKIAPAHRRAYRLAMKHFGLLRADEKFILYAINALCAKRGRNSDIPKPVWDMNKHMYIVPNREKFFMPKSEFYDLLDRVIYCRKNSLTFSYALTV